MRRWGCTRGLAHLCTSKVISWVCAHRSPAPQHASTTDVHTWIISCLKGGLTTKERINEHHDVMWDSPNAINLPFLEGFYHLYFWWFLRAAGTVGPAPAWIVSHGKCGEANLGCMVFETPAIGNELLSMDWLLKTFSRTVDSSMALGTNLPLAAQWEISEGSAQRLLMVVPRCICSILCVYLGKQPVVIISFWNSQGS